MYISDLTNETLTLICTQAFRFTVDPNVAALIQRLKLQATVFQCLIQLDMADTLTLHLSKQKQHIMISPAIMAN